MATNTFIDIGHTNVAYECIGSGPDVLFIHGWPLHRETWREVIGGLDGYRCHLVDLPGAGQSHPTADTPTDLLGLGDSVVRIIDQLDLPQVSLVAHNSGGVFTRLAAAERSDRVNALVLAGTEIPGSHPWQVALYQMLATLPSNSSTAAGGDNALRLMLSDGALAASPVALGGSFSDLANIDERFVSMIGDFFSNEATADTQIGLIRNFDTDVVDGLRNVHAQLEMPTLFIWGEDDPFFPVEQARAMATQFAGPTTFKVISDAKLFVHEEHPKRFAELTKAFLDQGR